MKFDTIIAERPTKTVYRDGDLAIKLFSAECHKADILSEALNLARVEETGGRWAIVTNYIEGETLEALMKKKPEKFDEYLELFVNIQLEVQSKRAPLLNKLKDKMMRKISESGLDATTRYELHTRLDSMPKHIKVCHGDFNPSNVIISPDGKWTVIDWTHATQGNASADAARTYLLFSLKGETETADRYLKLFCEKSDTAKQYVQRWLPIVAASQLVKGKPEEKEFLTHWASVVEYE